MAANRAQRDSLAAVQREVAACRRCPRLVSWREEVARTGRASYAGQVYWGRGVPGFGDPRASLVIVGLAPAAHGANRTGRMFTGDRSGDWLFAALHRAGFASQPTSTAPDDGLTLQGAYITAAVHCAPPRQQARARGARGLRALPGPRAVAAQRRRGRGRAGAVRLAGGGVAVRPAAAPGVRPPGRGTLPDGVVLLGSYHPSQQNTFTGKLTVPMFDAVFRRARRLIAAAGKPGARAGQDTRS